MKGCKVNSFWESPNLQSLYGYGGHMFQTIGISMRFSQSENLYFSKFSSNVLELTNTDTSDVFFQKWQPFLCNWLTSATRLICSQAPTRSSLKWRIQIWWCKDKGKRRTPHFWAWFWLQMILVCIHFCMHQFSSVHG